MSRVYGLMSDLHAHHWSAFATTTPEGINSRLALICEEINRCSREVQKRGGSQIVIAGDVFHTRGAVAPSVFNPVKRTIDHWCAEGLEFHIIPGNHDLETRDARELTSAVKMLEAPGVQVWHKPSFHGTATLGFAFMPWHEKIKDLMAAIEKLADSIARHDLVDLFIHAGIDGVLKGVHDHGLTASDLAAFGFRNVFAGHYHHHAPMGDGVYSIGSPTHQTWSDVGTKAGWIIVNDGKPQWFASHAPSFVDVTGTEDPDDLWGIVDGNFVRAKLGAATPAEIKDWREQLTKLGAKGVVIQATPVTTAPVRTGSVVASIDRLDAAVASYCDAQGLSAAVKARSNDILTKVAT